MSQDVKYNAKKSAVVIFRSATLKGCSIPEFNLKGVTLHVVATYKYLGNYISDDLSDDDDINRQRRTLYVHIGNIILRTFSMCSLAVKLTLFRSYCSPMHGEQLWWNYKKSTLNRLHIAYHNILSCLLVCQNLKVPACYALCLMYNAANQLLGIWCVDLCVELIALLTIF